MVDYLVEEAYIKAIKLLKSCVTPYGFTASLLNEENYYAVWARDSSISSLAALQTKDTNLINGAIRSMKTLLKKVAENGQIPSYVEIEKKLTEYGGYGSITSVDSNLWVIITSAQIYKYTKNKTFISDSYIETYIKIMRHVYSIDINHDGLLEVPEAGDWADIFGRNYHILFDQVLYYLALSQFQYLLKVKLENTPNNPENKLIKKIERYLKKIPSRKFTVKTKLNKYFWLETDEDKKRLCDKYMIFSAVPQESFSFYQSHLIPFKNYWMHRFDTIGNLLALIADIPNEERSKKIIKYILDNKVNYPVPLSCLHPVVEEGDKDWLEIYSIKERPYTYHNGGTWPMISGFWIEALMHHSSKKKLAEKELKRFAEELEKSEWVFPEYFHGKTGERMGKFHMAWSAAGYIIAYNAVKNNLKVFK